MLQMFKGQPLRLAHISHEFSSVGNVIDSGHMTYLRRFHWQACEGDISSDLLIMTQDWIIGLPLAASVLSLASHGLQR
jgi:hypothetical protein